MRTKPILPALAVISVLVWAAGCGNQEKQGARKDAQGNSVAVQNAAEQATPVQVVPATQETVLLTVNVTGSLAALNSVTLSPKASGRVVSVAGREGSRVGAGQVVVQQETDDLIRQLRQAEANLQAARANLSAAEAGRTAAEARLAQARTNYQLQVTATRTGVVDAEQQLRAAEANLKLVKEPQRSQEVNVAENNVRQAEANFEKARTDRERYESLVREGAAAQITLDQYVTQEKVAKAALDSAREQLTIAREGGRTEQIQSAETAVARAQAQVRLARSNQRQVQVSANEVQAARAALAQANAQIAQARAAVAQNEAAVGLARQAVENAAIRSPMNGVIAERLTEPGQVVAPGVNVIRLVALDTVYFEADAPETDVALLREGQPVSVTVDAIPSKVFKGRIARLYPVANATSRVVTVRVEIPNGAGLLRPGLYARGTVLADRVENATTVPVDAILSDPIGSKDAAEARDALADVRLFVVENDTARERKVTRGEMTADGKRVQVSNVRPGEQVVIAGQRGIKDGDRVSIMQGQPSQQAEGNRPQAQNRL